eukprot:357736-Chlamydomonas_euryale.AAC.5
MPPLAMAVPSLASEPPTRHAPPLAESSGSMQHTQTAQRALLVSLIRQRETSGCTNVVHAARSGVRDSRGLPTPFTGPLNPLCERLSSPGSTNAVHLLWPDVVLAAFDSAKPGRRGAHVAVADGTCPARRSVLEHVVGRAAAAVACAVPEHVARGPPAVAAARPAHPAATAAETRTSALIAGCDANRESALRGAYPMHRARTRQLGSSRTPHKPGMEKIRPAVHACQQQRFMLLRTPTLNPVASHPNPKTCCFAPQP